MKTAIGSKLNIDATMKLPGEDHSLPAALRREDALFLFCFCCCNRA